MRVVTKQEKLFINPQRHQNSNKQNKYSKGSQLSKKN